MRQPVESAGSISSELATIREKADNITQVVTTITQVADQTNLLSINAASAAEKAGEYGRASWWWPARSAGWPTRRRWQRWTFGPFWPPNSRATWAPAASPGPAARGRPGVALPGGAAGRRLVKRTTCCAQIRRGA
jgi:hypothetical protein